MGKLSRIIKRRPLLSRALSKLQLKELKKLDFVTRNKIIQSHLQAGENIETIKRRLK